MVKCLLFKLFVIGLYGECNYDVDHSVITVLTLLWLRTF